MNNFVNHEFITQSMDLDKIPDGDASYFIVILSTMGGFLILGEILDEFPEFFSSNSMKKFILWCFIYSQIKTIGIASLYSIIIVLLFPKIFFGTPSGIKLKAKQENIENKKIKEKVSVLWDERKK